MDNTLCRAFPKTDKGLYLSHERLPHCSFGSWSSALDCKALARLSLFLQCIPLDISLRSLIPAAGGGSSTGCDRELDEARPLPGGCCLLDGCLPGWTGRWRRLPSTRPDGPLILLDAIGAWISAQCDFGADRRANSEVGTLAEWPVVGLKCDIAHSSCFREKEGVSSVASTLSIMAAGVFHIETCSIGDNLACWLGASWGVTSMIRRLAYCLSHSVRDLP